MTTKSDKNQNWIEYWVSEIDEYGDVIGYTSQTFAREDRGGKEAFAEMDGDFRYDDARSKIIERVKSTGNEFDGVEDREYETLAVRMR